jgi:hypothetical protein
MAREGKPPRTGAREFGADTVRHPSRGARRILAPVDTIGRSLYLEPGEVEALADAARQAANTGPPHPRQLLLRALAAELAARAGAKHECLLAPAPRRAGRRAARRYVKGRLPSSPPGAWARVAGWVAAGLLLAWLGTHVAQDVLVGLRDLARELAALPGLPSAGL